MDTLYEILVDLWYMIGAPTMPWFIENAIYIITGVMILVILFSPLLIVIGFKAIFNGFRKKGGYF